MKRSVFCAAILAAAGAASSASADVVVNFTNLSMAGFFFNELFTPGELTGTLTGVSISVTLNASVNYTYANDLTVYLDPSPLSAGGTLQVGGFSNLGAVERYGWANGGSDVVGTTCIDTVTLTTPIDMSTTVDTLWLGNGYGADDTSGTWTGSITLIGVTEVPAPGSAALLGLGGLVALRRRRA